MDGIQSIPFNNFSAPTLEPIWAPKSFVFLALNILTLGIYGAAETLSKQYRVKELKVIQANLQHQAADLTGRWNEIENKLSHLLTQLKSATGTEKKLESDFHQVSVEKDLLGREKISSDYEVSPSISEVALGTIAFVGQLFANILTLGLYGVYQNYTLKNKITILEAQNEFIHTQFNELKENKESQITHVIELVNEHFNLKRDAIDIENTDVGKEHQKLRVAKQEIEDLKKKQKQLQDDLVNLKVQKQAFEKLEREAKDLVVRNQHLENDKFTLRQERDNYKKQYAQKDLEYQNLQAKKNKEIADLQNQCWTVKAKADRVQELEREVSKFKTANQHKPEIDKLHAEIGSVPPKYVARKDDKECKGALDIVSDAQSGQPVDPQVLASAKAYKKRYEGKRSAAAVVEASFEFAWKELMTMAEKGDKIKINNSLETPASFGAQAVYRYMILDLIKGGKVFLDGCHGMALAINGDVTMYPSRPEKVLHYKYDQATQQLKPEVVLHYTQRDDFTPSAEGLGLRDGVDAVSARWILEQLSDAEKEHLFNLLMSPVMEPTHPDYQKTRDFMRNKHDPRVQLIGTAYDLIADMGTAIQKKFGTNALIPCWQDVADGDQPPFVNKEDECPDLKKIEDTDLIKGSNEQVEWTLDLDVLGDKRTRLGKQSQPEFVDLITWAQIKYNTVFQNMDKKLVMNPRKEGEQIAKVTWNEINAQYHVSHEMIDADFQGNGGQRCLFSNLLATLVDDKKHLTKDNVLKLKKAMAAYLDKLQAAKQEWAHVKNQPVKDKTTKQLEELAKLALAFETSIRNTHHLSVADYQAWLRDEPLAVNKVNISSLTPFEIQLGAYTMGVKIGLLAIYDKLNNPDCPAKVDEYGRIVPIADYYGPNTQACLFMGCTNGTYYGLFPIINLEGNDQLENQLDESDYQNLVDLKAYWTSIKK